ncbi:hypothetical protein BDP81DRAFT_2418 [Colletotrichum phormii]|uniref:Uncharacterized protein n=1 Tax=Colletotrichum phormii TaxID=359342 RepID=A0AAJ0EN77_9PEZI|nr:uncharacterized protein BDP81DRAFT_2418 [Colletotrichum phormii]KAK1655324.1 hypothetical protein BDP81DRAFT_2418 [Colletotrichum phormii]
MQLDPKHCQNTLFLLPPFLISLSIASVSSLLHLFFISSQEKSAIAAGNPVCNLVCASRGDPDCFLTLLTPPRRSHATRIYHRRHTSSRPYLSVSTLPISTSRDRPSHIWKDTGPERTIHTFAKTTYLHILSSPANHIPVRNSTRHISLPHATSDTS